jgi:hypothetical protein
LVAITVPPSQPTTRIRPQPLEWDLVCIQRAEFGGGTISFDGEVIRKDGLFKHPDLQALNE